MNDIVVDVPSDQTGIGIFCFVIIMGGGTIFFDSRFFDFCLVVIVGLDKAFSDFTVCTFKMIEQCADKRNLQKQFFAFCLFFVVYCLLLGVEIYNNFIHN